MLYCSPGISAHQTEKFRLFHFRAESSSRDFWLRLNDGKTCSSYEHYKLANLYEVQELVEEVLQELRVMRVAHNELKVL